ncbi:pyridoxal phosphate-dependent aminotransferase [Halalkalicoccus sp. NIPERK01]|uniref:pyridoxal phosphate-dependent aminotransferase n=1 Tax=Halalkalicoccus sp. NIPERK01 TaxID=3053469 RepID=UPI00256EF747|nr:pyridoxal phosphate-dependent aminotransferase [Halalkalicoccus sp. NIPERK01]MDL5361625.1 pyridoxal phosphate-dependent aminotransferase [Halalkalicoccus sp. NIPERK01]
MDYEKPLFFRVMQYAAEADRDVIDMVSGNPDWEPPEALREGLREYADLPVERFQYPPSDGLRELREEIASRRSVPVESVIVTNGAGEANYLAMAEALDRNAGSEVILTDPVYPYYPGKTRMLGGEPVYVPVEGDGRLDPAAVRERADDGTAAIVVNSPNNPTGAVYGERTVEELVAIAEEYDAILVSDEVYDHFDQSGRFTSALSVDSEHRAVTTGFSKSMAITGFRVGYTVLPPALADPARTRHMLVNVTGSRPAQYAVLRALRETGPDYYEATREMLAERIGAFTDALDSAGAEYTRPDGAFYVLARFEGFPGTMANVERLIDEAGVAGMPGEAFGSSRVQWLRFALVTPRAEEAADRLAKFFA